MNESILISITESGSRVVIRQINSIATSADKASASAINLKDSLRFGGTTRSINAVGTSLSGLKTELTALSGASSHLVALKNALASLSTSGTALTNLVNALTRLNTASANLTQFSRVLQQIQTHAGATDTVATAVHRLGSALGILQAFKAELVSIVAATPHVQALAAALRSLGAIRGDVGGLTNTVKQLQRELAQAAQQAANAQRIIQQMGGTGRQASSSMWDLRNSLAGVAAYMIAGQVREWLDAWQSAAGLFKIATDNLEQMHIVQKKVTDAAKDTRQDFTATTELYARLQRASQDVGASQNEMIKFTRGVGTVLAIQHTSANQARGALVQLGQALGMQNIRAQEFRSMNENLYVVLQTVAKNMDGMGGSVNKLRQKMLTGKLASKDFFEAFLRGLPGLEEAFSKTSRTISQGFSVLNTSFIETIGHLDDAIGFSDKFGRLLAVIGNNLEYIIPLVIGLGVALAGAFGPAVLGMASGALTRFMGLMAINPIVALVAGLVALATYITLVKDQFLLGTQSTIVFDGKIHAVKATVGDFLSVLGDDTKNFFGAFWMVTSDAMSRIGSVVVTALDDIGSRLNMGSLGQELTKFFDVGETGFAGAMLKVARLFDWMGGAVRSTIMAFAIVFSEIPSIIEQSFKNGYNSMATWLDKMVNSAVKKINEIRAKLGRPLLAERELPKVEVKAGYFDELGKKLQIAVNEAMQPLKDKSAWTFENYLRDVIARADKLAQENEAKRLQAEQDLNKKNNPTLAPDKEALAAAARELEKLRKEYEKIQNIVDPIGVATREQNDALKVLSVATQKLGKDEKEVALYAERVKEHYADAVDALGKVNRELDKEIKNLGLAPELQKRAADIEKYKLELKKQGLELSAKELTDLEAKLKLHEELSRVNSIKQQVYSATIGKDKQKVDQETAIKQMINDPNSAVGTRQAKEFMMQQQPDLFAGTQDAIDEHLKLYDQMYRDIQFMRENDIVSEQTAAQMKANVKRKEQKEVLSAIGQGMDNLASLTQSKNKELARIGKIASIASATIKGYEAVQNALATPLPWPIPQGLAATAAVAAAANVANIVNTPIGFMTGGEFTVGGRGGADSQMVAFRASPGERVAVQTPQQYRKGDPNQESGTKETPPAQIKVVNVLDPALVGDYLATVQGEQLVMNVIQKNSSKVRNLTR